MKKKQSCRAFSEGPVRASRTLGLLHGRRFLGLRLLHGRRFRLLHGRLCGRFARSCWPSRVPAVLLALLFETKPRWPRCFPLSTRLLNSCPLSPDVLWYLTKRELEREVLQRFRPQGIRDLNFVSPHANRQVKVEVLALHAQPSCHVSCHANHMEYESRHIQMMPRACVAALLLQCRRVQQRAYGVCTYASASHSDSLKSAKTSASDNLSSRIKFRRRSVDRVCDQGRFILAENGCGDRRCKYAVCWAVPDRAMLCLVFPKTYLQAVPKGMGISEKFWKVMKSYGKL